MNNDEIIERYKNEGVDEGRDNINQYGDTNGFYALCGLALVLTLYKVWMEQPFGDVFSLLFVFLSVGSFFRYKKKKSKGHLWAFVVYGLVCLASLVWYVFVTAGIV